MGNGVDGLWVMGLMRWRKGEWRGRAFRFSHCKEAGHELINACFESCLGVFLSTPVRKEL